MEQHLQPLINSLKLPVSPHVVQHGRYAGTQPLTDELLVKLSRFYGVSVDYILCLTDKS